MDLFNAEMMARNLMAQHGLIANGWRFEWSRGLNQFGCCYCISKKITLSSHLVRLNSEEEIKNTILHELAHALCPPDEKHGWRWQAKCREIGARPERCFQVSEVNVPAPRYVAVCPDCSHKFFKHRLGKKCYNRYHRDCYYKANKGQLVYRLNHEKFTPGRKEVVEV